MLFIAICSNALTISYLIFFAAKELLFSTAKDLQRLNRREEAKSRRAAKATLNRQKKAVSAGAHKSLARRGTVSLQATMRQGANAKDKLTLLADRLIGMSSAYNHSLIDFFMRLGHMNSTLGLIMFRPDLVSARMIRRAHKTLLSRLKFFAK